MIDETGVGLGEEEKVTRLEILDRHLFADGCLVGGVAGDHVTVAAVDEVDQA